jgi:hypothetical protein
MRRRRGRTPNDAPDPSKLREAAERIVLALGVSPATSSRSMRDGYWPRAQTHVENYLLHHLFAVPVPAIAAGSGRSVSTIYHSIRVGKQLLARSTADELRRLLRPGPGRPRGKRPTTGTFPTADRA